MSTQPETGDRAQPPARQQSIKRRVIRLVLIPGVVALVMWLVASGYLVFTGFYVRQVASGVRQVSIPAVTALTSIQRERRLSISYLSETPRDMRELLTQRQQTDQQLGRLRETADAVLKSAPESITSRWRTLSTRLDELAGLRSTIDAGVASRPEVYEFYNSVLDAAADLFDTQARVVPDVTATQGGLAATQIFRAGDLMSRAGSMISGAMGTRALNEADHLQFSRYVGAYHAALLDVAPNLASRTGDLYQKLIGSPAWNELATVENTLISAGAWRDGVPRDVRVSPARWEQLTEQVSEAMIGLTVTQADQVSADALKTGNRQLSTAGIISMLALLIVVGAIVWAVRQSRVLVDRALSVRLAQLGEDAAAVVDRTLPDMMRRLRRKEKVEPAVELPTRDYGQDEIGQLAEVLNRSLHAAVDAAVDEANARAAGTAMLMGVARRPQRPLQRGLKVVEDLQNRIGDEKLLAELFDINHQLTQTRRFLENLIILAGGQTGRRFPKPVPIRRILLAAIAETQQYQRVTVRRSAEVSVQGPAVAGTIHLLAELLDNALAFSPPSSTAWISCGLSERGVVIEIEDAGVGITHTDLERANELLDNAPTPDVTVLKDGSQIGLWVVAELARRDGLQVTLRTSAYGGVLAIVLLPERVIASTTEVPTMDEPEPTSPFQASVAPAAPIPSRTFTARASVPSQAPAVVVASVADFPQAMPAIPASTPVVASPAVEAGRSAPAIVAGPGPGPGPGPGTNTGPAANSGPIVNTGPGANSGPIVSTGPGPGTSTGDVRRTGAAELLGGRTGDVIRSATPPAAPARPAARPPLPQRRPQEHLAPELREDGSATTGGITPPTTPPRSPEETRSRFTNYQQGWRSGQAADSTETPAGN